MARIVEQDYPAEGRGEMTRGALKEVSEGEVQVVNLDYDRLSDMEQSQRLDRMFEDGREYVFELVRHVMERANQSFGGSTSQGDEVGFRVIRPTDMETSTAQGVATGTLHSFDHVWGALGDVDIFGTTGDPVNMRDNADAEALYIIAWSSDHTAPKTESIQGRKFGRDFVVQPLAWDHIADDRGNLKVIEASPHHVVFAGEQIEFNTVVFATGNDNLRAVGVYVATGTELRTAIPDETA